MKSTFQLPNLHDSQCWEYINNIGSTLYMNYYTTVRSSCKNNQNNKCCRDINYYLDLIIGIIRSSKLKEPDKISFINQVENHWNNKFVRVTGYNCKREEEKEGNYSKEKRSILKQLYDVCKDKDMTHFNPVLYDEHLKNKWTVIINSNSYISGDLSFNINGESLTKNGKYKDFLLNYEDFNCTGYDNINLSHILVENEALEQKPLVEVSGSHEDISISHEVSEKIEVIPTFTQEDSVSKTEIGTSGILNLKNLPITFVSLSGISSFFYILYKV
ncbi:VIR protein [Plasmodium vivax]|uniref:VIR protein n=1 Tax=Plasmodium vivax TaxID=5855 RepID=A0A1G4E6H8_PLAVI|nr:VIR protein [Plasmodium vivax]